MNTSEAVAAAQVAPLSWKERQRQEREALILEVAEALLAEKGYHTMAMEEIAARVGIAKGTVYLHFASKDDLVVALFERELARFRRAVEDAAGGSGSAADRLTQIMAHTYAEIQHGRTHLLLTLASDPHVKNDLLAKRLSLRDHIAQVNAAIQRILEDGKAAGEFDRAIPTAVMLTTFLALLSPRSYEPLLANGGIASDELVVHVARIYFSGITRQATPEK